MTACLKRWLKRLTWRLSKNAVNAVLDHLLEDVGLEKVKIEDIEDFYWYCEEPELYDSYKKPGDLSVGRLSDDEHFVRLIRRGEGGDISYNLVHVAPLLLYIAHKIKRWRAQAALVRWLIGQMKSTSPVTAFIRTLRAMIRFHSIPAGVFSVFRGGRFDVETSMVAGI
jgi:hypothetical protein